MMHTPEQIELINGKIQQIKKTTELLYTSEQMNSISKKALEQLNQNINKTS
ncbi:hypothetical protein D3C71_2202460 [compost metagenome]